MIFICFVCVYALVLYGSFEIATVIPVEEQITCNSLKCECTDPALSKISCYFPDESVYLPTGVSTYLRSSKIEGRNVSIYIPDQDFEDSWSVIESFEIYGSRKNFRFHLPYRFTRKLHQITLFQLRNVSSIMTLDNVAFSNMTLLEHLDLSGNEFMKTEHLVHALTELTSVRMKTLNLSRVLIASKFTLYKTVELTPFTAVEKLTQQIPIIKHLDLSWTRAYFSFVELKSLPNLVTLNISGTLKNPFYGCVALQQHRRLEVLRMDNWPEVWRMNLPNAGNNSQAYFNPTNISKPHDCSHTQRRCYPLPPKLKELYLNKADANKFYINMENNACISSNLEYLNIRELKANGPLGAITGLHNLIYFESEIVYKLAESL